MSSQSLYTFPEALYISGNSIQNYTAESWEEIDRDPRGVLLMWSPPRKNTKYIMGLDPTEGITGWTRGSRTKEDLKTDNAAIEVFEVDAIREQLYEETPEGRKPVYDSITKKPKYLYRDLQVAEFAAPCDSVEIARIAYVIGCIYAGDEEDQCELIWEAWPGPGILCTQELIRVGYANLWHWEYLDTIAEDTGRLGWRSSRETQKLLWYRSRRHLMNRSAIIRSSYLKAEYANAEIDMEKMRARAAYGYHDDRFQAANMCFWAGHKWSYEVEHTEDRVTTSAVNDYQNYAPTLDEYESYSDWRERATADWD